MDGRATHIDIAKGISIALIAMFHSELCAQFPGIVEPMSLFRVPLFFLLSGVFFAWAETPRSFLTRKSEALLKPYFSVLFLLLILSFLIGEDDFISQLKGIFYGNGETIRWGPLWFLTHLFSVFVFSYILFRYAKLDILKAGPIALIVFFIVAGTHFVDFFWQREISLSSGTIELPGLPFSIDIILITSAYFILGRILKNKLINFRPALWAFILSLAVFLLITKFTDAYINLNNRVYEDPVFATLGALCGIYMVLSVSYIISRYDWLSYIPLRLGQASLYILIFHLVVMTKFFDYFAGFSSSEGYLVFLAFVSLGLGLFIPLIIKWLVEKSDLLSLAFQPFKSNKLFQQMLHVRR